MSIQTLTGALVREVSKVVVGKEEQTRLMAAAILAGGHILLEDLPGVGKTTLVKALALALGCRFRRVQFTPDLLPSDVVGMNIYDRQTGEFRRMDGPVFTNLLLADELNRAIPRTQSALLEAMEERQVTLDGESRTLPDPFVVLATQNPVESESTFKLPAAQLDRFLIRLSLGYPGEAQEVEMLARVGDAIPFDAVEAVTAAAELAALRWESSRVTVSAAVASYLTALTRATRSHPGLRLGASPRASKALYQCARTLAAGEGRDFATPDDIQTLAVPVLAHRLVLTAEARMSGVTPEQVLEELIRAIPIPPGRDKLFVSRPEEVR